MSEHQHPAFPVAEDHKVAADLPWTCGLTKREWFAGKALSGLVISEGYDAQKLAARSYELADAMLEAGAEPKPDPVPQRLTYDAWTTPALEHLAIKRLAEWPDFADLPPLIRDFVAVAASEIQKSEDGIPF